MATRKIYKTVSHDRPNLVPEKMQGGGYRTRAELYYFASIWKLNHMTRASISRVHSTHELSDGLRQTVTRLWIGDALTPADERSLLVETTEYSTFVSRPPDHPPSEFRSLLRKLEKKGVQQPSIAEYVTPTPFDPYREPGDDFPPDPHRRKLEVSHFRFPPPKKRKLPDDD